MKVQYDSNLIFDLPTNYDLDERLLLINCLLDDYSDILFLSDELDNKHDFKVSKVLDGFAFYLCTYKTNINKDSEVIRTRRASTIKKKEIPLFDFYL